MFPEGLSPLSALQRMASPVYNAANWILDQAQELATDSSVSDAFLSLLEVTTPTEATSMEIDVPSSPVPITGRC
jgi:hypothetical protein